MEQEENKKLDEIAETVTFLKENAAMRQDVATRADVAEIKTEVAGVKADVAEILEVVTFIKDHAAMQEDMDARFERIDGELRAIRADIEDIKHRLAALEKRTLEDADAASKDILELRGRVEELERKIATLEHAQQPAPA